MLLKCITRQTRSWKKMDLKRFILAAFIILLIAVPAAAFSKNGIDYADMRKAASTVGDGKNNSLNGTILGNGRLADVTCLQNCTGFTSPTNNYSDSSYTVLKDRDMFYAVNGTTGTSDSSNTDASIVAQYALDNLASRGGGSMIFREGHFPLNINITGNNISVSGSGRGTVFIQNSVTQPVLRTLHDFTTVKDISIIGSPASTVPLLLLSNSSRFMGNNIRIEEGGNNAIQIEGAATNQSHASQWYNIWILNNTGYGIYQKANSYDAQWSNVWIGNIGGVGIRLESGANSFSNTHVWGNGSARAPTVIQLRSDRNRFINCYAESGEVGIDIFGANYNVIVDCYIYNNNKTGISITGNANGTRIINNEFRDNNRSLLASTPDIRIQGTNTNNTVISLNYIEQGIYGITNNNLTTSITQNIGVGGFDYGNQPSQPNVGLEGDTYFNITAGYPCYRNATSWNRFNDGVGNC